MTIDSLRRAWRLGPFSRLKPYMTAWERTVFETLIRTFEPASVLEWGSGSSTLYFPCLLPNDARWLAIEHDNGWAEKTRQRCLKSTTIRYAQGPPPPYTDPNTDGWPKDFQEYIHAADDVAPFDLAIIDGRVRLACLEHSHTLLSDRGAVILHDANRPYYDPTQVDPYKFWVEMTSTYDADSGGIWIGTDHVETFQTLKDLTNLHVVKSDSKITVKTS